MIPCARCGGSHPAPRRQPADPFWSRVCKTDGCWNWTGSINKRTGYGKASEAKLAHRVSWELHFGAIPKALFVCHRCDNRRCVRPSHLFIGTAKDNTQDALQKGRLVDVQRLPRARGERVNTARLTEAQVLEMRRKFAAGGCTTADLGREYGVRQAHAWNIVHGRSWKHLPVPPFRRMS